MSLEDRYRRLLGAYPRSYRDRRGEEMVATLLEGAVPGQERPSRGEVVDLLSGALRERLGLHAVPGLAAGLRIAGPVGLALAAGAAGSDWVVGPRSWASAAIAVVWLLALASWTIAPRTGGVAVLLAAVVTAVLGDAAVPPASADGLPVAGPDWQSIELVCGLVALLAMVTVRPRPPASLRVGALLAAGLLTTSAVMASGGHYGRQHLAHSYPLWLRLLWLLPAAMLVIGLGRALRQRGTAWLWASLLVAIPVPEAQVWGYSDWDPPVGGVLSNVKDHKALLALVVVAATVYCAVRQQLARSRDRQAGLAAAGSLCLGAAGGIVGYLLVDTAYHPFEARLDSLAVLAAITVTMLVALVLPAWGTRAIAAGLAVALFVLAYTRYGELDLEPVAAVCLLMLVAALTFRGGRLVSLAAMAITIGIIGACSWAILGGPMAWPSGTVQGLVMPLVAAAVLVPTAGWAAVAVVRATHYPVPATVAFAASLLWLTLVVGPAHDSRIISAWVAGAVVLLIGVRGVWQQRVPLAAQP